MNDPIVVIERSGDKRSYCFLYDVPPGVIRTIPGTTEHPVFSPSSTLPKYVDLVLTAGEIAALDDGTAVFTTRSYKILGDAAYVKSEVQRLYAKIKSDLADEYTKRYQYLGLRIEES